MFALPQMSPVPVLNFAVGAVDWPAAGFLVFWAVGAVLIASFLSLLRSSIGRSFAAPDKRAEKTCAPQAAVWPKLKEGRALRGAGATPVIGQRLSASLASGR